MLVFTCRIKKRASDPLELEMCVFSRHLAYFTCAGIGILVLMIVQQEFLAAESPLLPTELSLIWS